MKLPQGMTPRPVQEDLYHQISALLSTRRVVFVDAPTGVGKSALAYALLQDVPSGAVVTATKQLQSQYLDTFEDLAPLLGRRNFECVGGCTCEEGFYRRIGTKRKRAYCEGCTYCAHIDTAQESNVYVANYASFLYVAKEWEKRTLTVFDEGHRLEEELLGVLHVDIDDRWAKLAHLDPPGENCTEDDLFVWVAEWVEGIKEHCKHDDLQPERDRKLMAVALLLGDFRNFLRWIPQRHGEYRFERVTFKPLKLSRSVVDRWVLDRTDKAVVLSATLLNPAEMAKNLRLEDDEWGYIRCDTAFAAEQRRVVMCRNSMPVTRNTLNDAKWLIASEVERLMNEHDKEKGLVHTSSTEIAQFLKRNVRDLDERLLLAVGRERIAALEEHQASEKPTVLLSPSMTEGVDLKDELARFMVIAKAPFMSLGDKQTAQRAQIDPLWYQMHTLRQIIQAAGRGTRHETDYCITYVLDTKVKEILEKYESHVPLWFLASWSEE